MPAGTPGPTTVDLDELAEKMTRLSANLRTIMLYVRPNLGRLLGYQTEDLNQYFTGSEQQRATLRQRFGDYQRNVLEVRQGLRKGRQNGVTDGAG